MYFYIDYENVGVNGLIGVEKLTDADNVRIYFSNNPNMKMETVKKVVQCKSKFNFYKMPDSMKKMNLENALDIILLNDVLRMSESLGDNYAVVVSKDTEFDEIIEEINEKNNFNRIFRVGSIAEGCQPQELIEKSETEKQNITEETSFVIDEKCT